ncbi:hypothetical protein JOQ06_009509, partial [Pogonophryne albipinna]
AGAPEQGKPPLQSSEGHGSCGSNTSAQIPNPHVTVTGSGQCHGPDPQYTQPTSCSDHRDWAHIGISIPRFSALHSQQIHSPTPPPLAITMVTEEAPGM